MVRGQVERLDATVTDIVDRTRLQVIRADELLNRTMDRIEETSDAVHRTVISPVRQLSGVIQGLTAGLEFLLGGKGAAGTMFPFRRMKCLSSLQCSFR